MAGYHPGEASQFADGSWGVQPHWGRITLAWLVDSILVAALVAMLLVASAPAYADEPAGFGVLLILFTPLTPWLLGFLCFMGYTPGTLICGTRLVRTSNGRAPGFWRGGWLMFQRTFLVPLSSFWLLMGALNGSTPSDDGDWIRRFHVSIDPRRTAGLRNGSWRPSSRPAASR